MISHFQSMTLSIYKCVPLTYSLTHIGPMFSINRWWRG